MATFKPFRVNPAVSPLVAEMFKLANDQEISRKTIEGRSGISASNLASWSGGTCGPSLANYVRVLDALGFRIKVERK